jgi:hypothetical protein
VLVLMLVGVLVLVLVLLLLLAWLALLLSLLLGGLHPLGRLSLEVFCRSPVSAEADKSGWSASSQQTHR